MVSVIIIQFNLSLELIPILVIQVGNDVSDQCSNNKCDNNVTTILIATAAPVESSLSNSSSTTIEIDFDHELYM